MPRKPRIHYEGALYHVIVRGNNRFEVFETKENKAEYLKLIKKYKSKYGFKLYAYCVMDNHAHLLIEVDKIPLSKIMQLIQQVYTQHYNLDYKRTGHVFEQRYKAIICDKNSYLLNLIRYIHMNPVKANIGEGLEYKWSSHSAYIKQNSEMIDCEFPLSLFTASKNKRQKLYLRFVTEDETDELEDYELSEEQTETRINFGCKERTLQMGLDEIINKTINYFEFTEEALKSKKRNKEISRARRVIIILARKYTKESSISIGKAIGVTKSLVSKVDIHLLKIDEELNIVYNLIDNKLNSTFQP